MTLTTETVRVQYSGDATTTAFPVTYPFWSVDDLQVILTDASDVETTWTRGVNYTVSGGGGSTGTVTATTAPASGTTLTILSNLDDKQNTSLPAGGAFPSASVEEQLDKIVRLVQQKAEALGRALKFAVSSADSDVTFPDITGNAEKLIRVNAAGDGLEAAALSTLDGSALTIPVTVAQGGTNAITAAAARTSLGLAIGTDVNAHMDTVSQVDAEAGTATDRRAWTAQRVGQAIAALAPSALPTSYLRGLRLSHGGSTSITVGAGSARDDGDAADMVLASATAKTSSAWAVGNTNGGLDTGTVANSTWYHVWLIKRSDTGVVDALYSTSATAPTMPTNYDLKRRIGAVLTDGSAGFISFHHRGDEFYWNLPVADASTTLSTASRSAVTVTTPPDVRGIFGVSVSANNTQNVYALLTGTSLSDTAASASTFNAGNQIGAEVGGSVPRQQIQVRVDASRQIGVRGSVATAYVLTTHGWIDRRGRDD